jgi:hypothetical protein
LETHIIVTRLSANATTQQQETSDLGVRLK